MNPWEKNLSKKRRSYDMVLLELFVSTAGFVALDGQRDLLIPLMRRVPVKAVEKLKTRTYRFKGT